MSLKKYEGLISRMCKELAALYVTKEDARAVSGRAELDVRDISFTDKSNETWRNIIIYAIDHRQLLPLIETCQKEHNTSIVLLEAINQFYKKEMDVEPSSTSSAQDDIELLHQLLENLEAAFIGVNAQTISRDDLYRRVRKRLKIEDEISLEELFTTHFESMNQFEKRLHKILRAYTDYIKANHEQALSILLRLKHLEKRINGLRALRRHIDFWLHKYKSVFMQEPSMCILYTGIDEKLPFPKGVESEIKKYLDGPDQ